jgi:hypothetical protein
VEQEQAAIARQWKGKQTSAAMNQYTTIDKLLEVVFFV